MGRWLPLSQQQPREHVYDDADTVSHAITQHRRFRERLEDPRLRRRQGLAVIAPLPEEMTRAWKQPRTYLWVFDALQDPTAWQLQHRIAWQLRTHYVAKAKAPFMAAAMMESASLPPHKINATAGIAHETKDAARSHTAGDAGATSAAAARNH
jgi:hypothetical protein